MLSTTGLSTKGTTISGSDPPETVSNPDNSINVLGQVWFPKEDILKLIIGEINFVKKVRGKKSAALAGKITDTFTRSDCGELLKFLISWVNLHLYLGVSNLIFMTLHYER